MKTGVYQIRNLKNSKLYIGSASNKGFNDRWGLHLKQLNENSHHSIHLQRAWNKYGADVFAFEILETCDPQQCIEREQYYLDTLLFANCNDERFKQFGYNICRVAGSSLGRETSDETKRKISQSRRGQQNSLGRKMSRESRLKMSQSHIGIQAGEKHPMAKLNQQNVRQIRKMLSAGVTPKEVALMSNISRRTVYDIKLRKSWRHV
jgi:group I intron endonuclease